MKSDLSSCPQATLCSRLAEPFWTPFAKPNPIMIDGTTPP
jgi:hypothetical protein